jgi:hypothetical protein
MMIETTPRQKIEVLVDAPLAPQLARLAEEAGRVPGNPGFFWQTNSRLN